MVSSTSWVEFQLIVSRERLKHVGLSLQRESTGAAGHRCAICVSSTLWLELSIQGFHLYNIFSATKIRSMGIGRERESMGGHRCAIWVYALIFLSIGKLGPGQSNPGAQLSTFSGQTVRPRGLTVRFWRRTFGPRGQLSGAQLPEPTQGFIFQIYFAH